MFIDPLDSVGLSTSSNKFDIEMDLDADHESETEIIPRHSKRAGKDLSYNFCSGFYLYLVEGDRTTLRNSMLILNVKGDPLTFNEAMTTRDAFFFLERGY